MSLKIAVSGSTGLVGQSVQDHFHKQNAQIKRIVRRSEDVKDDGTTILLDRQRQTIDHDALDDQDVVIHLAGANISGKRWDDDYKTEILLSRTETTKIISNSLSKMPHPPKLFICASAIGFYGNAEADVTFDENSIVGRGFLADVCHQWEEATLPARERGIRVVHLRIGAVLSKKGGAIAKMWIPFIMGMGGKLGNGQQMFSWVALEEIPLIIDYVINNELIQGPVNVTSPNPATNTEFTKAFGRAIKRPTVFPVPGFGARLLFGEMADALLLNGARVLPKKLVDAGYTFEYGELETALKASLK